MNQTELARNLLSLIIADCKEVTDGKWHHSDEAEAEVECVEGIQAKAEKAYATLVEIVGV